MSDWKNQLNNIQNKIKGQFHARKLDDLEVIYSIMLKFDSDNSNTLNKYEFEKFLSHIGVFLTTQELRAVYNVYDTNQDGNINYQEFVDFIRTSMSEKRLAVVKHAYQFLDKKGEGKLELEYLKSTYRAAQHPRVRTKQKSAEQVQTEFINAITKKSLDGKFITEEQFLDYYADMNATMPNDKEEYFIDVILLTWGITSGADYVSPERLADLEIILYEKIRQKTITKEDEAKTAKKAFKYFDLLDKGVIDIAQFKAGLDKFGCVFNEKEIQALFSKYDKDKSGKICFDEFSNLFAQIGSGNVAVTNPVFEIQRIRPDELINKVKAILLKRGEYGIRGIARSFKRSDKNKNGVLDRNEFQWAMKDSGIQLTKTEYDNLFKYFDKNCDDSIHYNEFLFGLRGDLNERRKAVVKLAFEKLDKNKNGQITIEDLKGVYDASKHPDVKMGKRNPDDVLKEFLGQWDILEKNGIVTLPEFEEYYKDLSSSIDCDDMFEGIVKSAWKI